jgi:Brp/Blh family beta-carotene 15,15'-monooxygenase
MFSIIILNFIFSPLIAFTVYFCFLHSIRHIISLSYELNKNDFSNGIKVFVKKALPLTVVTIIFYLIAVVFLSKSYGLNEVIIKVIFIGLASLTFPHILLEYLLEINEKRN